MPPLIPVSSRNLHLAYSPRYVTQSPPHHSLFICCPRDGESAHHARKQRCRCSTDWAYSTEFSLAHRMLPLSHSASPSTPADDYSVRRLLFHFAVVCVFSAVLFPHHHVVHSPSVNQRALGERKLPPCQRLSRVLEYPIVHTALLDCMCLDRKSELFVAVISLHSWFGSLSKSNPLFLSQDIVLRKFQRTCNTTAQCTAKALQCSPDPLAGLTKRDDEGSNRKKGVKPKRGGEGREE